MANQENCKYCFGEIDARAAKCKHCGEWLQREPDFLSKAKGAFEKGIGFLKAKNNKRIQKRWSHIYAPTYEKPLSIKDFSFLEYGYIFKGQKFLYSSIRSLYFTQFTMSTNGMMSSTDTELQIIIDDDDGIRLDIDEQKMIKHKINVSSGVMRSGSKTEREVLEFIYRFLAKTTFEKRLNIVLYSITNRGFFTYPGGVKIYQNGDITLGNKRKNIFEANENGLLVYGNHRLSGRITTTDPFKFCIYENKGIKVAFAGFELSSKLDFQVYHDKDVFDVILKYAIERKSFAVD